MDLADQQVGNAIIVPKISQGRGAVPLQIERKFKFRLLPVGRCFIELVDEEAADTPMLARY